MELAIDTQKKTLTATGEGAEPVEYDLYSPEAFAILSRLWLKAGWANRYSYDFQWLGRPIIQLPEDVLRLQELVWSTRPTVIVEAGIAHGGSAVFFASLLEILGEGKVISVDIEIRPHNREAIEAHPLFPRITLIERSSTAPETLEEIRSQIGPEDRVMVLLDSNHTKEHVAKELGLYGPLVTPGCYLVAGDGVMAVLHDVPGGDPAWKVDNPMAAVREFLEEKEDFELDEAYTRSGVSHFLGGYLRRVR